MVRGFSFVGAKGREEKFVTKLHQIVWSPWGKKTRDQSGLHTDKPGKLGKYIGDRDFDSRSAKGREKKFVTDHSNKSALILGASANSEFPAIQIGRVLHADEILGVPPDEVGWRYPQHAKKKRHWPDAAPRRRVKK